MKSLTDAPVPTRLKLSTLWTATMFCYVYGDYFGLYTDNKLASMAQGSLGPIGPATPGALVAVSLMMAIPAAAVWRDRWPVAAAQNTGRPATLPPTARERNSIEKASGMAGVCANARQAAPIITATAKCQRRSPRRSDRLP